MANLGETSVVFHTTPHAGVSSLTHGEWVCCPAKKRDTDDPNWHHAATGFDAAWYIPLRIYIKPRQNVFYLTFQCSVQE
jgi:hypothetical protein